MEFVPPLWGNYLSMNDSLESLSKDAPHDYSTGMNGGINTTKICHSFPYYGTGWHDKDARIELL